MKKITALLLAALMLAAFSSCGGNEGKENSGETTNSSPIEVDEGLFSVDLRIPKSFYNGQTDEEIYALLEGDGGAENIKITEDNYVEFTISKAEHEELLQSLRDSVKAFWDIPEEEKPMSSLVKIDHNKDMTEFDFLVDGEKYNALENITVLGFIQIPAYYQMLNGVTEEELDVKISFKDSESGELLDEMTYKQLKESFANLSASAE